MATAKDYELHQGNSKKITVRFTADAETLVTDGTITFTMREKMKDPTYVIEKVVPITVTDGIGEAVIIITPSDTESLVPKKYYYDIEFASLGRTEVKTLTIGGFTIRQDVTRYPNQPT